MRTRENRMSRAFAGTGWAGAGSPAPQAPAGGETQCLRQPGLWRQARMGFALILFFALTLGMALLAGPVWGADYPYPLLSNNVRSTTPGPNSSLDIHLTPVCENEDHIQAQVTWKGRSVGGVQVGLYDYRGGRHLAGDVLTGGDGWAYFKIRPAGSYDMTATVVNDRGASPGNGTFGQIFFDIPPCLSPPSGVPFGPMSDLPPAQATMLTQTYPNMTRQFEEITLADGEEATRVRLDVQAPAVKGSWLLVEEIPVGFATSAQALGFERDYPNEMQTGNTSYMSWTLSGQTGMVERTYVLMRPLTPELARRWGAPSLEILNSDGQNQSIGNSTNPTGAGALNAQSPAPDGSQNATLQNPGGSGGQNAGANAPVASSAAGIGLPFGIGGWALLALGALVLLAGGWMLHKGRSSKTEDRKEKKDV